MGYKILGYVVWNGGRIYLRRRYSHLPSRRVALIGLVGVIVLSLAATGAKRASD